GEVRRDHAVDAAALAVLLFQFAAHVALQVLVQRLDLVPEAVGFGLELGRTHVVAAAPEFAGVGVAEFLSTFVQQSGQLLVVLAHRRADRAPALPGVELLVVVAALAQHVLQLAQLAALAGRAFALAVLAGAVAAFKAGGDAG